MLYSAFVANILVVEDDQAIAQMIRLILTKHGHALQFAHNGLDALTLLDSWRPDLIISDVMMPGLDGFELAERLHQTDGLHDIPVIFVTALAQVEQISHGLKLGAVDYLTKPFRAMELEARVNNALRLKFLQDDLRRANAELTDLALNDSLTGLKNHRYVTEYLERALQQAARYNESLSVLMLDLDHFKRINDTYGHPFGNQVLQELAKILCAQARQADSVCRFGGEEFLLICPNTPLPAAGTLAERVRQAVAQHTFAALPDENITISVGVATYEPKRDRDANAFLIRVDSALYLAKNEGRNVIRNAP